MTLQSVLNFTPTTLASVLNFSNKSLNSALNFTEQKFSDYFEPKPGKVRIRDVAREAQAIISKIAPNQEYLKSEYEKAQPRSIRGMELNRTSSSGLLITKKPDGSFSFFDPLAFSGGGMKNVAKEGLDAVGRQLLKNIKGATPD